MLSTLHRFRKMNFGANLPLFGSVLRSYCFFDIFCHFFNFSKNRQTKQAFFFVWLFFVLFSLISTFFQRHCKKWKWTINPRKTGAKKFKIVLFSIHWLYQIWISDFDWKFFSTILVMLTISPHCLFDPLLTCFFQTSQSWVCWTSFCYSFFWSLKLFKLFFFVFFD